MSYCRWSSDDSKSDLYVYENVSGVWTIHIAETRYATTPPPSYDWPEEHRVYCDARRLSFTTTPEGVDAHRKWMKENWKMVPIDLPHVGETFNTDGPAECADKIEELIAFGYHCPAGVVEELREEAIAMEARRAETLGSVHDSAAIAQNKAGGGE